MNRQYNQYQPQPQHQPTRKRARRIVQPHQPQQRHQPVPQAKESGLDGLTVLLLMLIAAMAAWGVLS